MSAYDPAQDTVAEVKEYVAENPGDVDEVLAAETEGKNRSTLVSWLEGQSEQVHAEQQAGVPEQQVLTPDQVVVGSFGEFPLPDDRHYFGLLSSSPFIHSGTDPEDADAIRLIQAKVGAEQTGEFDVDTGTLVSAWRDIHGTDEGDFVDEPLWRLMDSTVDEPT